MKNFEWTEPQTVEQALAWLAKANGKAVLMAGGTDLFTEIKETSSSRTWSSTSSPSPGWLRSRKMKRESVSGR